MLDISEPLAHPNAIRLGRPYPLETTVVDLVESFPIFQCQTHIRLAGNLAIG